MALKRDKSNLGAQARNYGEDCILFLKSVVYGDMHFVDKGGRQHALEMASMRERITAAQALLDRGYGKPAQAVQVGADDETAGALRVIVEHISGRRGTADPDS